MRSPTCRRRMQVKTELEWAARPPAWSRGFLCMEGERITASQPLGESGSHSPLRVRELTPKPVTLMLAAKAMQGPTMARPNTLPAITHGSYHLTKKACKHDEAVVVSVAHSATLIKV